MGNFILNKKIQMSDGPGVLVKLCSCLCGLANCFLSVTCLVVCLGSWGDKVQTPSLVYKKDTMFLFYIIMFSIVGTACLCGCIIAVTKVQALSYLTALLVCGGYLTAIIMFWVKASVAFTAMGA